MPGDAPPGGNSRCLRRAAGAGLAGPNAFGQSLNGPNPADPAGDILSALDHWVVNQTAPNAIVATKYVNNVPAQGVEFQRPLCPYPQVAKYNGTGTTTSAASFTCVDDSRGEERSREEVSNR